MSIEQQAAEVIAHETRAPGASITRGKDRALLAAQALADAGLLADNHHSVDELYAYRMAYNALLFNEWAAQGKYDVHKSWRHSDGEHCFGGGWFVVYATTPHGQVSNHYAGDYWHLFLCEARELPTVWDGHTPQEALLRLLATVARHARNTKENHDD